MIPARTYHGKRLALFGLGGSGMATAEALLAGGAEVLCCDDNPERMADARARGMATADLREADWSGFEALVLTPGVPLTHPRPHWSVALAHDVGIPIIGDIEIFAGQQRDKGGKFIAITGTNGKSTTTALIAHLIRHAGRDVQMGGNIGRPVLTLAPPGPGRNYVVEVSSYQIDLAPTAAADIAVLLNVTPDHLDRHGDLARYAAIKERLVRAARHPVIAVDDAHTAAIAERLIRAGKPVIRISTTGSLEQGYFAEGPILHEAEGGVIREVASLAGIGSLRGTHNAQNALAAWASCRLLGIGEDVLQQGLRCFSGLAHRMEQVGRRGRVLFVNDSKATNAEAAGLALASYPRIHWIAGGLGKEGGYDALLAQLPHVVRAYLIGDAAPALAAALGDRVPYEISGTLEVAVGRAAAEAAGEDVESVVLLSPACASFDQFRNFEVRGDRFRELVMALEGVHGMGGQS